MKQNFLTRKWCAICSKEISPFLSLGEQPLPDIFLEYHNLPEQKFPLEIAFCDECKLVQQVSIVNPNLMFNGEYAFFTGASPSSLKYFEEYAKDVLDKYPNQSSDFVVEIASNDGTLLKHFKTNGANILGVDPSTTATKTAIEQEIDTLEKFFNLEVADEICDKYGQASLVLANNVVAHVDDLADFILGVDRLLSDDGVFVAEVQYSMPLLRENEFDHFYHEHYSFFSMTAIKKAIEMGNLKVVDVQQTQAQGGSLRVFAKHSGKPSKAVLDLLDSEKNLDQFLCSSFADKVKDLKYNLLATLKQLKKEGKTIYGYGASAKSSTLLNYCGIGPELIDCIVDKTPYKIGKFSPGMHIPVISDEQVQGHEPDYYLLLAWNYLKGILEREKKYTDSGGKFIVPIPEVKII